MPTPQRGGIATLGPVREWNKPRAYPSYVATPTQPTPGAEETPEQKHARELVTASAYYQYLRSLPDAKEISGWRPDYKNLYQTPQKGGTEGFEPTPTRFPAAPIGMSKEDMDLYNPRSPFYYYPRIAHDFTTGKPATAQTPPEHRYVWPDYPMDNAANAVRVLEAIKYARSHGINLPPQALDPNYIGAKMLKEVRDEGGTNSTNSASYSAPIRRQHQQLYDMLAPRFGRNAADSMVAFLEKGRVSRKLGVDFSKAWNGTGNADPEAGGGSGSNYAYRMNGAFIPATRHGRNADFIATINSLIDPNTPYQTPMTEGQFEALRRMYNDRTRSARKKAEQELEANELRSLQQHLFGSERDNTILGRFFGLPRRLDPETAAEAVKPPDYKALTGRDDPSKYYAKGGTAIPDVYHPRARMRMK